MDMFDGYDWSGVKITDVHSVTATASDRLLVDNVKLDRYQLGVKFHGRTETRYGDRDLLFDTGSILYLPRENCADIPYSKYIRESGTGVCIFFTSTNPLPTEPILIKNASIPPRLFSKVLEAWREIGGDLACLAAFYQLLAEMKRATHDDKLGTPQQKLAEARMYIEQHYTESYIDLDELAAFCGLSKEYFRQSFKQAYGVTPLKFASRLKLIKAQKLLEDSSCDIGVIALMCGFEDANYFTRFFRRYAGMTPTQYRKMYRK